MVESMSTFVALLRGVNVGGHGKLPMEQLRAMFRSLGFTDVVSYIQSGNVVFSADQGSSIKAMGDAIEAAIETTFGFTAAVMIRSSAEMKTIIDRNPFADADTATLHVGFLTVQPAPSMLESLSVERFLPDQVCFDGDHIYFHLPNGMGRTKLPDYVGRQLKISTTVRNWNTVTKLVELVGG